jgi:hypothetical protein
VASSSSSASTSKLYDLTIVVEHYGVPGGGHYVVLIDRLVLLVFFLHRQVTYSIRSRVSSSELVSWTKNTRIYLGSSPSYRGNSLTSSGLMLIKTCVTNSEQRAQLVCV